MWSSLRCRDTTATERIDQDLLDPHLLERTYDQLAVVNAWFLPIDWLYRHRLKPLARQKVKPLTILDVGCGGGDVLAQLRERFVRDRTDVTMTGIDPDARAIEYSLRRRAGTGILFEQCHVDDLISRNQRFDVVLCSHVLHHLSAGSIPGFLNRIEELSTSRSIVFDIRRSQLSYSLFRQFGNLAFSSSYTVVDGLTSIRRAFTVEEARSLLPETWTVRRMFPFHLICETNDSQFCELLPKRSRRQSNSTLVRR